MEDRLVVHFDQRYQTKEVTDFLVHVREQGTPLRVDSDTETYYVLTATQLQQLLQATVADSPEDPDLPDNHAFTLEDFGVTEADVAAYEAVQKRQRAVLKRQKQQPLNAAVIRRLEALPRLEQLSPKHAAVEREELLRELETAMLNNLRTLIADAE